MCHYTHRYTYPHLLLLIHFFKNVQVIYISTHLFKEESVPALAVLKNFLFKCRMYCIYSLYAAIIVKKVDAQTRAKTAINDLLRD